MEENGTNPSKWPLKQQEVLTFKVEVWLGIEVRDLHGIISRNDNHLFGKRRFPPPKEFGFTISIKDNALVYIFFLLPSIEEYVCF